MNNICRYISQATLLPLACFIVGCSTEVERELPDSSSITAFEQLPISGATVGQWSAQYHPFVGATTIDIDGDGTMEVFLGGGEGFDDMLFSYTNKKLENIIAGTNISTKKVTHGANSIDIDGDGDTDLLLTRRDGLYLYLNQAGVFSEMRIPIELPLNSEPLNVAIGDIDRDGDGDLYISIFVDVPNFKSATYNDPNHAKTNILLLNNGDLTFTDITNSATTASLQNTFMSSFIDLNSDGWPDLIVAQNTGQVEIFKNNRDLTFSRQQLTTGWGFWMGLAVGDIDKDGDQDLFFTNSGSSIPAWLLEAIGDGNDAQPRNFDWIMLRNEGDFNFQEVTSEYQLNGYGFAWGAVFEDLTLNGELELLVAQNYIKWPFHKWFKFSGKSMVLVDEAYYNAPALGLDNPSFAQSPLIVDLNNDGRPDVFWVNMEGESRAFLNKSTSNFVTLTFPDTVDSLGVVAVLSTEAGTSYTRQLFNNIGLSTDQSPSLTFGLGEQKQVQQILITWPDGLSHRLRNPPINRTIKIKRSLAP